MGQGFNEVAYTLRLAAAEEILGRSSCAPRSLLEGAVGVGAYAPLWKKLGIQRWVGLDLSESAVERLKHRFADGEFAHVDLTAGDKTLQSVLSDERFDLVTAIDVLYHIVDKLEFRTALEGLAGRLAPGGYLLISDVFSERPTQVAPHVLRRPLAQYEGILSPRGVKLLARQPVFAILGDPVPRAGFHVRDLAMLGTWRILSKLIRTTPDAMRDSVGRAAAQALLPIDNFLKRTGRAQGLNLEFALFRAAPDSLRP
jgi:ubiquinone/menaquinone biosynthesis C-methylase UbiE